MLRRYECQRKARSPHGQKSTRHREVEDAKADAEVGSGAQVVRRNSSGTRCGGRSSFAHCHCAATRTSSTFGVGFGPRPSWPRSSTRSTLSRNAPLPWRTKSCPADLCTTVCASPPPVARGDTSTCRCDSAAAARVTCSRAPSSVAASASTSGRPVEGALQLA